MVREVKILPKCLAMRYSVAATDIIYNVNILYLSFTSTERKMKCSLLIVTVYL